MRLSNYQADPLAATMQTRSIGLANLNVTKNQVKQDKDLYNRSLRAGDQHMTGLKIDMTDQRSSTASTNIASPRVLKELSDVEQALYRKKISNEYHTAVPKFMRSQGPFAVYDHAAHKGGQSFNIYGSVNEQALQRFNKEIEGVQRVREHEK